MAAAKCTGCADVEMHIFFHKNISSKNSPFSARCMCGFNLKKESHHITLGKKSTPSLILCFRLTGGQVWFDGRSWWVKAASARGILLREALHDNTQSTIEPMRGTSREPWPPVLNTRVWDAVAPATDVLLGSFCKVSVTGWEFYFWFVCGCVMMTVEGGCERKHGCFMSAQAHICLRAVWSLTGQ